jgi:hypothetical protein
MHFTVAPHPTCMRLRRCWTAPPVVARNGQKPQAPEGRAMLQPESTGYLSPGAPIKRAFFKLISFMIPGKLLILRGLVRTILRSTGLCPPRGLRARAPNGRRACLLSFQNVSLMNAEQMIGHAASGRSLNSQRLCCERGSWGIDMSPGQRAAWPCSSRLHHT